MEGDGFNIREKNITVAGIGLIGGSLAEAIKELNPKNLWGVDIDRAALEAAEEMKIIDKGYTEAEVPLRDSDIVIVALYPGLTESFIRDNLKNFKKGAIITDVSGIKEKLVDDVNSFLRPDLEFIGGHPMAGRESRGLQYASKDIFKGANYILTPIERNKEETIKIIEDIIINIGCKNVVRVSPRQHDEIIAFTSQLPHILAVALLNIEVLNEEMTSFIAGSFKDSTRVAEINAALWDELLIFNRENIFNKLELFEENIKMIKNAIMESDHNFIRSELEKACKRRRELSELCIH